ncbi:MAG: hypothetical protein KKD44_11865 [Proteobacteria bacterium]|nr:hypothetical protein [Pseudomonadota bacterium]
MKRAACLTIWILLVFFQGQNLGAETSKMGYFMLPPHTFNDGVDGPAKGAGIVYFNEVAAKMGYDVEWIGPLPLPRLTEYLKKGGLIAGVLNIDQTIRILPMPAPPTSMYIVFSKNSPKNGKKLLDLCNGPYPACISIMSLF